MKNKIKPFYIDAVKHNLTETQADKLLGLCKTCPVLVEENYGNNVRQYDTTGAPFFGVMEGFEGRETFVCEMCDLDGETEISPDDVATWLEHGVTKAEYEQEQLKLVGLSDIEATPTSELLTGIFPKPPLGLRPRSIWLLERQREIVEALNRVVEQDGEIKVEWVEELLGLVEVK